MRRWRRKAREAGGGRKFVHALAPSAPCNSPELKASSGTQQPARWCHVKSTTCTYPPHITKTITVLTSQGRQPVFRGSRGQAPPVLTVTIILATRPVPLPLPVLPSPDPTPSSQSLAKRPADKISRKAVCQVASAPSLTSRASVNDVANGTSTRRHTR